MTHGDIKVIYISGYAEDAMTHQHLRQSDVNFIKKPFGVSQFLNVVRLALDGHPA